MFAESLPPQPEAALAHGRSGLKEFPAIKLTGGLSYFSNRHIPSLPSNHAPFYRPYCPFFAHYGFPEHCTSFDDGSLQAVDHPEASFLFFAIEEQGRAGDRVWSWIDGCWYCAGRSSERYEGEQTSSCLEMPI